MPNTGFNFTDFYWMADDGRIFSSARECTVSSTDAAFKKWCQMFSPSIWPRDDVGAQTDAALQEVLSPYGISVTPTTYTASKRYALETGGVTYKGNKIATDRESQAKIGNAALAATVVGPKFSTTWKCMDGSFVVFSQADVLAMATAVLSFVSDCFAAEAFVQSGIAKNSIKTRVDVDAIAWPSPSLK